MWELIVPLSGSGDKNDSGSGSGGQPSLFLHKRADFYFARLPFAPSTRYDGRYGYYYDEEGKTLNLKVVEERRKTEKFGYCLAMLQLNQAGDTAAEYKAIHDERKESDRKEQEEEEAAIKNGEAPPRRRGGFRGRGRRGGRGGSTAAAGPRKQRVLTPPEIPKRYARSEQVRYPIPLYSDSPLDLVFKPQAPEKSLWRSSFGTRGMRRPYLIHTRAFPREIREEIVSNSTPYEIGARVRSSAALLPFTFNSPELLVVRSLSSVGVSGLPLCSNCDRYCMLYPVPTRAGQHSTARSVVSASTLHDRLSLRFHTG